MTDSPLSQPCLRRRTLGALGVTGAAAIAMTGCGPDRGKNPDKPSSVTSDASGQVSLDEIPENATTVVDFGGSRGYVAVVRGSGEDLTGYSGYCTHQGCALSPQDEVLHCPCHGSTFELKDGTPEQGPAVEPLPTVKLTVTDGKVSRADA
ncbi:Rieske (2Fe-2S) protein [Helcobacillus massiliensis]|uniref:Cytochrome bc1 complex Rieske iron-sulfur subunit n=1 Tax=Helcobacillus massiliensis TaxID=521392 RepID=A0A839QX63_9MICO|nr:Rieske (2Fe-2S) protein [Helcobacillus massiliensis]MBB3023429.1 Rieske Fe-S protein [Helcobacillus massiliensis]MCT1557969.1 Rieske (2Fe-2S) protein [Helcobacillus massiliensis]MCT2037053.1 Rieske (2Fe-2S) protein [Helcobacillus massiliensis]MCT2332825.1 Rieske (2Fe-2S) protein [Helcobacillus massiliensis]MDK7743104.1 Rieske (2Fe-2S) protein [Helcobacillus massiliensis]